MMKTVITVTYKTIDCALFLRTACKSYVIEIQSFIAALCVCVHLVLLALFAFKPNYICILDALCLCVWDFNPKPAEVWFSMTGRGKAVEWKTLSVYPVGSF